MTKTANEESNLDKCARFDDKQLIKNILSLISRFFADGEILVSHDQSYYTVISSDRTEPESETFIDIIGAADGPNGAIATYAITVQRISS